MVTKKQDPLSEELDTPEEKPESTKQAPVFTVNMEGTYYASTPHGKVSKPYTITVRLPGECMDRAMSVIKNKLLTPLLSKKYEDYSGYRTYSIVDISAPKGVELKTNNIRLMKRTQLKSYIDSRDLNVDDTLYPKMQDLREAIMMAEEDPKRYATHEAALRESAELDNMLGDLNEGFRGFEE